VHLRRASALLAAIALAVLGGPAGATDDGGVAPAEAPPRTLLFGDLHVHSSWSFDAYASEVAGKPRDAWRYARGEAIRHWNGEEIRLAGPPLDFMALTDHAEYLGVPQSAGDPEHVLREQPLIETWARGTNANRQRAWHRIQSSFNRRQGLPSLMQDAVIEPAWKKLVTLANEQNEPGLFSAIVGFEFTSNPKGRNLHRNVLFRSASTPSRPFSAMDSPNPEDLWRWMDEARAAGHELLSIPHNPNGSDGAMFAETRFDGRPIDAAWIDLRSRNEPAAEIFQIKGTSETHPSLSPDDPWADFEIIDVRTTWPAKPSEPGGSYVRDALKRGLALARTHGSNPYRLGVVASTDGHNAASPFEEANYSGKIGSTDGDRVARLRPVQPAPNAEPITSLVTKWGAAGLAGVWAESNTREAIFDALRRRETYGTSGPRLRVRLAAGWDLSRKDASDPGAILSRTDEVVPMGSVLPEAPGPDARATIIAMAERDPLSGPLDRLQVVKGWIDEVGATHERVFDVACAGGDAPDPTRHRCTHTPPDPDLTTCAWKEDSGASQLSGVFRDPESNASTSAFYYVRVLEVPTCRWSTHESNRLGQVRPRGVPATIHERAVTSPVWTR